MVRTKTGGGPGREHRISDQRRKQAERAAVLLKQVSDPTRLQVLLILLEGEKHVGGLCDRLRQGQPAVSHHLALLRHGGIITPRRQGKNNFYSLTETGAELAEVVKKVVA
jgi:DNA-binding transcriptional ArsR family regulator